MKITDMLSDIGITSIVWIDDQFAKSSPEEKRRQLSALVKTAAEKNIVLSNENFSDLAQCAIEVRDSNVDKKVQAIADDNLDAVLQSVTQDVKEVNSEGFLDKDLKSLQFSALEVDMQCALKKFSFSEWEAQQNTFLSNDCSSTLFLVDREATNENLGGRKGDEILSILAQNSYTKHSTCLLLTHTITPNDADGVRSQITKSNTNIPQHFFSVMSKSSIGDSSENVVMEFKRALCSVLISRTCQDLTASAIDPIKKVLDELASTISGLAVEDVDAAIFRSAEAEGCMEIDIIERIVRSAQHSAVLTSFSEKSQLHEKLAKLAKLRQHHKSKPAGSCIAQSVKCENCRKQTPCYITCQTSRSNSSSSLQEFQKWRKDEVFLCGSLINKLHQPLSCGDVFEKTGFGKKFVLIAQPCDLMVRPDGRRTQKEAVFAEIVTTEPKGLSSCFLKIEGAGVHGGDWFVDFRHTAFVDLRVLDFSVFSDDGCITLSQKMKKPNNLLEGLAKLFDTAKKGLRDGEIMYLALNNDVVKSCSAMVKAGSVSFPYKRIGRISQPWSHAILAAFATYHARVALDHNFARIPIS